MSVKCDFHEIIPAGLVLDGYEIRDAELVIQARSAACDDGCPDCGVVATSVHSRYLRTLHDLPAHGRRVIIQVTVRRFRCREAACARRTFAERLAGTVEAKYARRTKRTDLLVHQIALALGGRPGERLTARLSMRWSRDTLLRIIRRRLPVKKDADALQVVGIDDWAWRRGQSYGTVICDLERHRIVALLPDRDAGSVQRWLAACPGVRIVARDRGGTYARAASRGAPDAIQVADRWHLMANASAAFLEAVRRSMRWIRETLGAGTVDPALLTCAERRQLEGAKRREEANAAILALAQDGVSVKEIVRRTGYSRGTVRRVVCGGRSDVFRPRRSSLAPFQETLEREWINGCRNGAELHRRLTTTGFAGSLRVVTEWATRRRREEAALAKRVFRKCPSARTIAKMMTTHRDGEAKRQIVMLAMVEAAVPDLVGARDLLDEFHAIVRERKGDCLDAWIARADNSLLASFAIGLAADRSAVEAALSEPWSSGQVEGQITKLKLLKRQMYSRAKIDLLEARLLCAA
jgi:transposase